MNAFIAQLRLRVFRLTLLQRFTLIGLVMTCVIATGVSLVLSRFLVQSELDHLSNNVDTITTTYLATHITGDDFSAPTPQRLERWARLAQPLIETSNVVHVKVWNTKGQVLYSDEPSLIGRSFSSHKLEVALSGEVVQEVSELDKADNRAEAAFARLLEVYIPVKLAGTEEVIGVFGVYQLYEPIAAKLRALRVFVWVYAFLASGALFGSLYLLVRRASKQLTHMAYRDPLTGLANRHLLYERIDHALADAQPGKGHVGLLYLDLSRFKAVNDTLGHVMGDELLQAIGARLSKLVRRQDTVARIGGDEFVVVFPEVDSKEIARALAERVQSGLREAFTLDRRSLHVGANLGLALYPEDASSRTDLIHKANIALYQTKAKNLGLGVYEGERPRYTSEELQLEEDLHKAVVLGELLLHYQPVWDFRSGEILGVEALVRWHHPTKGFIPPLDFIPLAEETGLIRDIDHWTLREAVRQSAGWAAQGVRLEIAVNLSPKTFSDSRFVPYLAKTLCAFAFDPKCLVLEITERVLLDTENARAALMEIGALGVKVALDDFGMGFSSLAYLETLDIDCLKIDRHFVQGISVRPASEAIIRTVVALAHNLGIKVIAEGIESGEQHAWLASVGCDSAQGYLLGRPMSASDFLARYQQHRELDLQEVYH